MGKAPKNDRPQNKIEISKQKEEEKARMEADDDDKKEDASQNEDEESKLEIIRLKKQREKKRTPIDKQSAFLEFKSTPEGNAIEDQIINNREDLKLRK